MAITDPPSTLEPVALTNRKTIPMKPTDRDRLHSRLLDQREKVRLHSGSHAEAHQWSEGVQDLCDLASSSIDSDLADRLDQKVSEALDGIDFAVGAAEGIGNYAKNNKAKFAGGTVGAATMIAAIPLGPIACIIIGIGAAATTEFVIRKAEDKFEKKKSSEQPEFGSENNDIGSATHSATHSTAYMY